MFSVHMQYICKLWIKQIDLASEGMNFNFELIRNLFTNTTPTPTMPTHLTIWAVVEISGIGTIVALFHSSHYVHLGEPSRVRTSRLIKLLKAESEIGSNW